MLASSISEIRQHTKEHQQQQQHEWRHQQQQHMHLTHVRSHANDTLNSSSSTRRCILSSPCQHLAPSAHAASHHGGAATPQSVPGQNQTRALSGCACSALGQKYTAAAKRKDRRCLDPEHTTVECISTWHWHCPAWGHMGPAAAHQQRLTHFLYMYAVPISSSYVGCLQL